MSIRNEKVLSAKIFFLRTHPRQPEIKKQQSICPTVFSVPVPLRPLMVYLPVLLLVYVPQLRRLQRLPYWYCASQSKTC